MVHSGSLCDDDVSLIYLLLVLCYSVEVFLLQFDNADNGLMICGSTYVIHCREGSTYIREDVYLDLCLD